ncbi:hypothetical protein BGZ95_003781 [Linnemannia exigua]|uniref:Uncharacterized protein n=1 Tax=Linnemannia exigua TaxID=604196 RepID=A0AAD4H2I1_9FUNG|nr:hypothetical protein BGZ95_003781 [Linnemannia exigua]
MRPDPHKQAASRKYHNKVKARGGGAAGTTGESTSASGSSSRGGGSGSGGGRGIGRGGAGSNRGSRGGGRGGRGGYRGRSGANDDEEEGEPDEDGEYAPRKSYSRRKITSNADRYIEHDEEVNEEDELEQGIDRQTIAFREMLKDSDQKKTFDPAAYFRFKSEKEVETQDALEDSQQARKLLEVRLNDIEAALMTLSIKDRLYLRDSDVKALDRDIVGKVSLTTGKPIVPKLVRGQVANDILIKPSTGASAASTTSMSTQYSKAVSGSADANKQGSIDDDLDELLDITKSYGRARTTPTPSSAAVPLSATVKPLATSTSTGAKFSLPPLSKGVKTNSSDTTSPPPARKALPPLKKGGPPSRPAEKKDEAWLDSVLGM